MWNDIQKLENLSNKFGETFEEVVCFLIGDGERFKFLGGCIGGRVISQELQMLNHAWRWSEESDCGTLFSEETSWIMGLLSLSSAK